MVVLKDENGFIPAGLSSELMRFSAENKNLLTRKGSLYVGTGRTQRVNYGKEIVEIPITEELLPPSFSPAILCVGSDGGLSWQKAYPALFSDSSYPIKTTAAKSSETVKKCSHAVEGEYTSENQEKTIWERMTALGLGR